MTKYAGGSDILTTDFGNIENGQILGAGNPAVTFFLTLLGWGSSLVENSMVDFGPALLGYVVSVGLAEESSKAAIGSASQTSIPQAVGSKRMTS